MNTAIVIRGVIGQVLLNVAEATFIHGKMIARRPFPVYHAKIMGCEFWYTQHKFETQRNPTQRELNVQGYRPDSIVRSGRVRHTLMGQDPHGFEWTVSLIIEASASSSQTEGYGAARSFSAPKTNELAWGTDRFFEFIDYEFSGHENIMRNQMTMMRFLTKDTFERYATEA